MKQHISEEQLRELNFKNVRSLGEYSGLISYPRTEEEWDRRKLIGYLTMYTSLIQYINIGRMIEILELIRPTLHINKTLKQGIMKTDRYEVFQQGLGTFCGETLCDALWEAVKATF